MSVSSQNPQGAAGSAPECRCGSFQVPPSFDELTKSDFQVERASGADPAAPTLSKTLVSRCIALFLSALVFAACTTPAGRPKPAPLAFNTFPSEQQQIYEALFLHMFAHWQHNGFKIPEHFFLWIGSFDAPDDLLVRFGAQGYAVAPGYRYRNGHGIMCSAEAIRFESRSRVTVYGGYLFGELGGEYGPFTLVKRQGRWTVVSWKPNIRA